MSSGKSYNVGILGATGTVGQRFISLLATHPEFKVHALGASARSAGKPYPSAVKWKMSSPIPKCVQEMTVHVCDPKYFEGCHFVFSGLDSDVAGEIEKAFQDADIPVFSNAKNYRMAPAVPLIVPTVNTSHFDVIPQQRALYNTKKGFIVTNANCSTTGLTVPLKALQDAFGPLDKIAVQTMQAISGAGYPGVSSLDILDNVVPFISGEEDKLETEPLKILGSVGSDGASFQELSQTTISAHCNRVPVLDGHLECVSLSFHQKPAPTPEQVIEVLEKYTCEAQALGCYSAPEKAIVYDPSSDRPQPRLDRDNCKGQTVTVGRVRKCNIFDIKFTLLVHNTILGAAGSGILNAEVAAAKGLFD
ncbi:aspartate-semialdehyde dehydrogenase [Basidiobolus meristosporus CBS 931.73]|uniref:Aspartate-semialdehyde dehydrogenase n=1 Tax=Basidiobolus meristosporus CBS 931.73 TaxID=1314790 RepID=A0A1Y1YUX2_9FUNG|nr:aspartate-semialdehyde dehydrogenase [Basidiobolus meristosporus CBS 931.73]|eukprot:ORY01779.1 aspartate-semialdehyde dehydrogenase [Basidiobolus meristosporus CBS 931.73]